ncbi:tRNA (adenosine(37)-N6)-threonylcarbamoyltransferase complex transferase subunit TsaD [Eubacteriales bacterium OttesenSCG-928-G02]|nr:tRNA (adenosine(37)-N6)-threonylcarbamoyltransferase complex transferase subunit TsaD [Eubacteriales bacterium OttesenSCG-928-G02]
MYILGIESSCDETAAAVVKDGREIVSSIVASQVSIHALYGGVVPEIASRTHTEAINGVVTQALEKANLTLKDIDAIAVTNAPGLIGALLVGVSFAKSLAYAANLPLIPTHHIRGHVAANYLAFPALKPPFYSLVVSGGHTSLMLVKDYTDYEIIGQARDDAAGEAFDKVARVLGLPYPGGAAMDRLAYEGDKHKIKFPLSSVEDNEYDFSFSGLKTAVINYLHREEMRGTKIDDTMKADIAASFTNTLVQTITLRIKKLLESKKALPVVLSGGVAANSHLRNAVIALCEEYQVEAFMPPLSLCGDNAAMIASQGYYEYKNGCIGDLNLNAYATKQV